MRASSTTAGFAFLPSITFTKKQKLFHVFARSLLWCTRRSVVCSSFCGVLVVLWCARRSVVCSSVCGVLVGLWCARHSVVCSVLWCVLCVGVCNMG